ncbi:MAG: trypsin-like peptidase domain-containing protein [Candidatus Hydrogenedentes bacterium]|nr:trypsin-like peptidase domain-containing protein [Candidatus Hydrogenedentota bacterium]
MKSTGKFPIAVLVAALLSTPFLVAPCGHAQAASDSGGGKIVYGTDDRIDVFEETDPARIALADSTCSLLFNNELADNGDGTFTILTGGYVVEGRTACEGERFAFQPTAPFCTGFLVADDIIATAGHCYDSTRINNVRFVFGFRMLDAVNVRNVVDASEVYQGVEVLGQMLDNNSGLDYAVVRVDRTVTAPGAAPLEIRRQGTIANNTAIGVIGYPSGLPEKIAFGANTKVQNNSNPVFFVANLDTYGGNSGSPVFNAATGVVEGILVRGGRDFNFTGSCFFTNTVSDSPGGEGVTRSTTFDQFIPGSGSGEGEGEGEGEEPPVEDVEVLLLFYVLFDADENGRLSVDEASLSLAAFNALDTNLDAFLTEAELQAFLDVNSPGVIGCVAGSASPTGFPGDVLLLALSIVCLLARGRMPYASHVIFRSRPVARQSRR